MQEDGTKVEENWRSPGVLTESIPNKIQALLYKVSFQGEKIY